MASKRRQRRRSEHGFTLIELMIVIAIIAVLVAIVLPQFIGESNKTKANAETAAFFAELQAREEQYKVDQGKYLAVTTACPAGTPGAATKPIDVCATTVWQGGTAATNLNVQVPFTNAYCQYDLGAGTGAVGTAVPTGFTMVAPTGVWYFVHAKCDIDGDGTTFSEYFVSSVNASITVLNEGE